MNIVKLDIQMKFALKKQKNIHIFNLLLIREVTEKQKHDMVYEFHELELVILQINDGLMI
jgi:hypothetical protein